MNEYQQHKLMIRNKLIQEVDTTVKRRINWDWLIDIVAFKEKESIERVRLQFEELVEDGIFRIDDSPLGGVMININNSKHKSSNRHFIPEASVASIEQCLELRKPTNNSLRSLKRYK